MIQNHLIVRATYTYTHAPRTRVTLSVSIRQGEEDPPLELLAVRDMLQEFLRDYIRPFKDPHTINPFELATAGAIYMGERFPGRFWQSHVHLTRGVGAVVTHWEKVEPHYYAFAAHPFLPEQNDWDSDRCSVCGMSVTAAYHDKRSGT